MTLVLDDLELELRKIPGVRAAGFEARDDLLLVQLHLSGGTADRSLLVEATRIAARHSDRPVAVELIRWRDRTPESGSVTPIAPDGPGEPDGTDRAADAGGEAGRRPRLLAVLSFPDTDELEVHLILEGRRAIGKSPASRGLVGAVEATLDAVRGLGADLPATCRWVRPVDSHEEDVTLVAVAITEEHAERPTVTHYGLAGGPSAPDAAARATLDSVNRRLASALT